MFDAEPPFVRAADFYDKFMKFVANVLFGLTILAGMALVAFGIYVAVVTSHPHRTPNTQPTPPAATAPQ